MRTLASSAFRLQDDDDDLDELEDDDDEEEDEEDEEGEDEEGWQVASRVSTSV